MTAAPATGAAPRPAAASNGAVWSLLLPQAERILCHAPGPAAWLHELARRGVHVDVVTRCDAEAWLGGGTAPPRLRCAWHVDAEVEYDLAVLWDPSTLHDVRAWLQDLERLAAPPREIAVWSRNPWRRDRGVAWPVIDALLRHAGWRLGASHVALPEADRVRQLVGWNEWRGTTLVQHRRSHRAWKSWVARTSFYRWMLPARLRRASLRGVTTAPAALDGVLAEIARRAGGSVRLERWLVSPNGVAIAALRLEGAGADQNAILKIPYVLAAEGRVARNAAGLEWLEGRADTLGRWGRVAPCLLGRGRAGHWNYTLEERVEGGDAQAWRAEDGAAAMTELCGYLEALAARGEAARPLDAEALDRHVGAPVRRTAALLDPDLAQRLHALGERVQARLTGVPVPLVPRHGDFKLENVIGTPGVPESLRVIDWELWSPSGLPLVDLWHLLASRRARAAGCAMGRVVRDWLLADALSDDERAMVRRVGRDLDPRYVEVSPLLYWLDRIGPIAARGSWPQPGWERANVVPVLDASRAERATVAV